MARILSRYLLPTLLFPAFSALAFHFLFGHLVKSGAGAQLAAQCSPKAGPHSLNYIGHPAADRTLCILVTVFHAAFDPTTQPVLFQFAGSGGVLFILPFVESARLGRSLFLSLPVVVAFGLGFQRLGAGIAYPLFWTLIIFSGGTRLRSGTQSKITRAYAEANLLALFILATLSAAMYILQDPKVTAAWQMFPAWMGVARFSYSLLRPSTAKSGYSITQFTYLLTFVASAVSHIAVLVLLIQDPAAFKLAFYPPVKAPSFEATTVVSAARVFLQWDLYFTLGSSIVGCHWFAQTPKQLVAITIWSALLSVALGPGAAISAILMWREQRLNGKGANTVKTKRR